MKTEPKTNNKARTGSSAPLRVRRSRVERSREVVKKGFKAAKTTLNYRDLRRSPYGLKPLMLLVFLGFFLSLDATAFGAVAPAIIRDLNIEVQQIVNVIQFVGFLFIFGSVGVAYYADRHPRVPLVGGFTIFAGIFSFLTGRATGVGTLGMFRVGESLGGTVSRIPVFSLFADYYPPEMRGRAIAFSGAVTRSAGLFSALAFAYWATAVGWRVPFTAAGFVIAAGGVVALFVLKEPIRGYMERRAMGIDEDDARAEVEAPSLGESWRTVWAVRTLRRLFIISIFEDAGLRLVGAYLFLFLFDKYGLSIIDLALLGTFLGIFTIVGGIVGGGLVDVLLKRRPERILTMFGMFSLASALALIPTVMAAPLWMIVSIGAVFAFAGALLGPAASVLFIQIVPANTRTLGLAVQGLAAIPSVLLIATANNTLFPRYGFQGTMAAGIPFAVVAALIYFTAAGLFDRDRRAATAANVASLEWRRAKESGTAKMLVCRDVDVEYDGVQVLFGVDFDVEEGEIIALLGTNGAGKSTLLRAISGTQEASNGAIVFDGRDITHMPPHEITLRRVVHMPGGRGVFPDLTVRENLLLGTWVVDEEEGKKGLEEVYDVFPALRVRMDTRAGSLSGGEQQMVSLAQAFLSKPRLLMIDELSLGLAPAMVEQLIESVKRIHASGVTIIIVEQSVNIALTIAEKAIFMEKGEVRFFGETRELLRRPDVLRAVYVKGSAAMGIGTPASALKGERELREYELEKSRPVLQIQHVSKSYGGITAVKDVSFDLREGETLGLIGPNGAGKTTLFDVITGYQPPDEGQIIFDGVDVTGLVAHQRANLGLVRRFQDARLFPSLNVFENLLVALDGKLEVRNILLTAMQIPQVRQSEKRIRLRAEALIELLDLGAYRDKFVKELSTGLRRLVDLACVLASEPRVLMLDEPSSGIAQSEAEGLAPLLRRIRVETRCSMLIIEHDMPLISAISDELVAMDQGEVLLRGAPEDVKNDPRVIESYLGGTEEVIQRTGLVV